MSIRKSFLSALSLFLFLGFLSAQNTNSPFSRYGFGTLDNDNQALGKTRAMGGIGFGLREKSMINPMNPASYSAVDTLNLLFDIGFSSTYTKFKENGVSQSNPNGSFDYVAMKFALKRNWGLAIGLMPYSKVGYSYGTYKEMRNKDGEKISYNTTYKGTGGLNTLFLGTGLSLGSDLSLGLNYKYVFGSIAHAGATTSSYSGFYPESTTENFYLNASSLDLGVQYQKKFGLKSKAILGAVFSNKSRFTNGEVSTLVYDGNETNGDTTNLKFDLPNTMGLGFTYTYDNRLTFGVDYQYQTWGKSNFLSKKDTLSNNSRISFGVEYLPSVLATSYFQAIRYRFGMQYSDSYLKLESGKLKNLGLTFGFGLPLRNQKSMLNIAFEAGKVITPSAISLSENYYKVSLDISFNELWFFKTKL